MATNHLLVMGWSKIVYNRFPIEKLLQDHLLGKKKIWYFFSPWRFRWKVTPHFKGAGHIRQGGFQTFTVKFLGRPFLVGGFNPSEKY